MEPENDGLEDDFAFQLGAFRFRVNFPGDLISRGGWHRGALRFPYDFHLPWGTLRETNSLHLKIRV